MKNPKANKNKGDSSRPAGQTDPVRLVDKAIRKAEIQIAKGKRTGQGIGSVRTPGGAGKKRKR